MGDLQRPFSQPSFSNSLTVDFRVSYVMPDEDLIQVQKRDDLF
jgi:hypothetical protein